MTGFVFAATTHTYRSLARRAARTLRLILPDAAIDLFSDCPVNDPVFDMEWPLTHISTRPKMEALRRSRFDRTIFLDCDTVVVADCSDIFDVLTQFDIAGAHEMYGNAPVTLTDFGRAKPPAFRQINSGVLGVRRSKKTQEFLMSWENTVQNKKARWDQPVLNELLWDEHELRVCILPPEYNFMHTGFLPAAGAKMAAPRILHLPKLHKIKAITDHPELPYDISEVLSPHVFAAMRNQLLKDKSLGARPSLAQKLSETVNRYPQLERRTRSIRRLFW